MPAGNGRDCRKPFGELERVEPSRIFKRIQQRVRWGAGQHFAKNVISRAKTGEGVMRRGACILVHQLIETFFDKLSNAGGQWPSSVFWRGFCMRAARRRPFRPNAATGKRQGTAGVHHPLGSPCFWFISESCRKQDAAERREQHERSASLNAHFFLLRSFSHGDVMESVAAMDLHSQKIYVKICFGSSRKSAGAHVSCLCHENAEKIRRSAILFALLPALGCNVLSSLGFP